MTHQLAFNENLHKLKHSSSVVRVYTCSHDAQESGFRQGKSLLQSPLPEKLHSGLLTTWYFEE